MIIQGAGKQTLHFLKKPIDLEVTDSQLSSDGGLLLIREFDEQIGLTEQFAAALHDPRAPGSTTHKVEEMTRSRVYGILGAYEDQNDHDTLRSDPVFKLLAGRSPDDDDLASQPTLSRFENSVDIASLRRLRDVFLDQFVASFPQPPRRLVIDLDAVDDPAHGEQQLVLFHGFYDQYQYLPLVITCADNDQFVMLSLRPGNMHPAKGADDDLQYMVTHLRQVWPDVQIVVRGDCGFGVPWMYAVCERLELTYTFGLTTNTVLKKASDALLEQAVAVFEKTGEVQRLFHGFWYQAKGWPFPRWVVVKVEVNALGTNRRFVVTNRPGARVIPDAAYDEYVQRGESENRNKEFKCDLAMDRLSDHRFKANFFRLYLHLAAMNLIVRLRNQIADPPPVQLISDLPKDALPAKQRRRYARLRRQRDPLGHGHPCTWRMLVIKVAVQVHVHCRRTLVQLSNSWPHLRYFHHVSRNLVPKLQPAGADSS